MLSQCRLSDLGRRARRSVPQVVAQGGGRDVCYRRAPILIASISGAYWLEPWQSLPRGSVSTGHGQLSWPNQTALKLW